MSTGGWEDGGTASTPAADTWEEWVVLALLVLVAVVLVALGCWLWRNCTAARRDAAEGEATSSVHIKQRKVSVEEQSALLQAGTLPGPRVLDVGGAMLCQDPPLPEHPYENVMSAESLGVPQYENVRNVPPWLQLLFSRARRGLPVPRPPPRPYRSGIAAQASNLHPQGRNRTGLHQQQAALVLTRGHQQSHVGSPPKLQPGLSSDGMEVFRAEPVATSTPQSSSGSSPESGGLDRTARGTRGSRPPVRQSLETWHVPGRHSSSSQQTCHDREHGASVLALRGGHRHFKPSWTRRGSKDSAVEPVYEQLQAVPMGLATPIRRESPPHGEQPAATRWEGHPPVNSAPPPDGLPGAKPPGVPEADSRGPHALQRRPLQLRGESAAAEPQPLPHQRSLTSPSSSSTGRKKPPRPLPRTSLQKSRGAAPSLQLEVDVHAEPRSYSLTRSPDALPSARSSQLRK